MTSEEILEGSKLIACFMGIDTKIEEAQKLGGGGYNRCRYHESWNWIIPVAQKCCEEISKRPNMDARGGWTPEYGYTEEIYTMRLNSSIESVWRATIFSINKINKLKK